MRFPEWVSTVCKIIKPAPIILPGWVFILLLIFPVGEVLSQSSLRLDEFKKTLPPNELIPDWKNGKFSPILGDGEEYFFQFVKEGKNKSYLHLKSGKDNSFSVGYEKKIEISEWPVLEWEWKITKTPKGGDVRIENRDDQAGAMCVVIDPGMTSFDSSICYIFENDGPKNKPITSTKSDKARYFIIRTVKKDKLGVWYQERRNVLRDYKLAFGKEPSKKGVIGVQIDSNDTETSAEAYYRNIILRKK